VKNTCQELNASQVATLSD